jgi:hypothetical protein
LKDAIRATVDESLIEMTDSAIESSDFVPDTPDQIAPDVPQAGNQNEKATDEQDAHSGRINTELAAEIPFPVIGDIIIETLIGDSIQNVTPNPSGENENEVILQMDPSCGRIVAIGSGGRWNSN